MRRGAVIVCVGIALVVSGVAQERSSAQECDSVFPVAAGGVFLVEKGDFKRV
jgi:hypothetical protein